MEGRLSWENVVSNGFCLRLGGSQHTTGDGGTAHRERVGPVGRSDRPGR